MDRDMRIATRNASAAMRAIFNNLSDRRGIPSDLEHGDDWSDARRTTMEILRGFILSAIMESGERREGGE